ncbi:MAG TPA: hypothetical protein PLT06_05110 [Syntrophorhabdaceae bacterium]|jgi:flagellar export protein FliJ|nr:MAG: hypothetical protein BWX58_01088 [Deltaproteobacteria bacterium ADurb.Bin026]HNQ63493.1 hypothetical protein [Syntrophorhabdaceae bacterium]HOG39581.1 hypothetical protein [Syntrophorhabdaceae bacterium]HPH42295.1 hypothetical protein [Syntrophorhabdaceae bacterium]HQJ94206.1 hypothetical protein [Syntrophorhabdaceae bacterium]
MPAQRIKRIIKLKEKLMEDKQRQIRDVLLAIDEIMNNIRAIETNINVNYEHITATTICGGDLCLIKDNIIFLENKKGELIEEKEECNKKLDLLKMELIEQAREIKKLETLKIKTINAIKKAQNRKEQKIFDDIALHIKKE